MTYFLFISCRDAADASDKHRLLVLHRSIMPHKRRKRLISFYNIFLLFLFLLPKLCSSQMYSNREAFRPSELIGSSSFSRRLIHDQSHTPVAGNDDHIKIVGTNVGVISGQKVNGQNLGDFVQLVGINNDENSALPDLNGFIQVMSIGDGLKGQNSQNKIKVVQGPSLGSQENILKHDNNFETSSPQPQRLPYDRPYFSEPGRTDQSLDNANILSLENLHGRETHQVQYFVGEKALQLKTSAENNENKVHDQENNSDYPHAVLVSDSNSNPIVDVFISGSVTSNRVPISSEYNSDDSNDSIRRIDVQRPDLSHNSRRSYIKIPAHNIPKSHYNPERNRANTLDAQDNRRIFNVNIPGHGIIGQEDIPEAIPPSQPNPLISQPGNFGYVDMRNSDQHSASIGNANLDKKEQFYPISTGQSYPNIANNQPTIVSSSNVQYKFVDNDKSAPREKLQNQYPNFSNEFENKNLQPHTPVFDDNDNSHTINKATTLIADDNEITGSEQNFISIFENRGQYSNTDNGGRQNLAEIELSVEDLQEDKVPKYENIDIPSHVDYSYDNTENEAHHIDENVNEYYDDSSSHSGFISEDSERDPSIIDNRDQDIKTQTPDQEDIVHSTREDSTPLAPVCNSADNSRQLIVNPGADIFIGKEGIIYARVINKDSMLYMVSCAMRWLKIHYEEDNIEYCK